MTWKKIEPELTPIWNFSDVGPLEGEYCGKRENVGRHSSTIYSVKKTDGEEVSFWGNAVLDNRMEKVSVGTKIKIEYLGTEVSEKTKRQYKNFEVWTDD